MATETRTTTCSLCTREVIRMMPIVGTIICDKCLAACTVVTAEGRSSARVEDGAEVLQAARLWERVVTIWESDDGTPTKAYDPEILERIAALIDEWHTPEVPG